jgi:hypothetical protein
MGTPEVSTYVANFDGAGLASKTNAKEIKGLNMSQLDTSK